MEQICALIFITTSSFHNSWCKVARLSCNVMRCAADATTIETGQGIAYASH